jgi:diadenosine tetraphosphate (Ap4A) HIT family hydrolase
MSTRFALDARLIADTHAIGELPLSQLLLMDDARFPWLILVPRIAGARELIDLDERDQQSLLAEINLVGRALETLLNPNKLNVAALGNVVPQLHVHVIARFTGDAAWPQPVWGRGERLAYAETELAARIAQLRTALGAALA